MGSSSASPLSLPGVSENFLMAVSAAGGPGSSLGSTSGTSRIMGEAGLLKLTHQRLSLLLPRRLGG
jgi:hypothetical protein